MDGRCARTPQEAVAGPPANMAAPDFSAGEFEKWLNERLDSLGADREVYGSYILGVLHEEESDEEKSDALNDILSAFVVGTRRASCAPTRARSPTASCRTRSAHYAEPESCRCALYVVHLRREERAVRDWARQCNARGSV